MNITVTKDGPYLVAGAVPLIRQTILSDEQGFSVEWGEGETFPSGEEYKLCRCGRSDANPFCDEKTCGRMGFDGTETASRDPYLAQAEEIDGPRLILTDAERLCSFARFCDYGGQVWNLVERSDEDSVSLAVRETTRCPSGRLVSWDPRTRRPFEADYEPSIGVVEDPTQGVSGPLWVRGGIPVLAADGYRYETRNRQTLCRCGGSSNKPFCDTTHAAIGFSDGLGSGSGAG